MTQNTPSDDDLIAVADGIERRRKIILIAVALLDLLLGVWGGLIMGRPHPGRPVPPIETIPLLAAAVAINTVGLVLLSRQRTPAAADAPRILAKRTDRLQRGRSRALLAFPIFALLLTPGVWDSTLDILGGSARWIGLLSLAGVASLTVTYLTFLTGHAFKKPVRAAVDDELSRSLRARALQTGFWSLMAGGAALYVAGLYRPVWAVAGLPVLLMYAVGAAALHFAVLDRRAERGE